MLHAASIQDETAPRSLVRMIITSLILLSVLMIAIYVARGEKYAIAAGAGLVFLVWGAWRVWLLPAIYLSFIILFPNVGGGDEGYPVYYHINTFLPIFSAMIILLYADKVVAPDSIKHIPAPKDYLGILIIIYLCWSVFTYLRGIAIGNSWLFMFWEINYICMLGGYFFWRTYFRRHGNMITWTWFLLFLGIGTALETAFLIVSNFTDVISFIIFRILNRQPQIIMLTIPLATTLFLTRKAKWAKYGSGILVFMTIVHVFLSQQRSLWIASVIIAFVYFTLYIFRDSIDLKKFIVWFLLIILIIGLFTAVLFIAAWVLQTDLSLILTRWEDVESLTDDSFMIRYYDARKAVNDVGNDGLVGLGGGKMNNWVHTGKEFYYFDVSYVLAYYKGGWPMAILMTAVYLGCMIQSFRLYWKSKDRTTQLIGISFVSTFVALMFVGVFNCGLLFYRFIFIWMMIAAMSTVYLERLRDGSTSLVMGE
jgi:hypothetical protein